MRQASSVFTATERVQLMSLDRWAAAVYGPDAPALYTLRRWARDGRIYPAPVKQGRSYYVREDAQYVDMSKPSALMKAIHGSS